MAPQLWCEYLVKFRLDEKRSLIFFHSFDSLYLGYRRRHFNHSSDGLALAHSEDNRRKIVSLLPSTSSVDLLLTRMSA
jgi:hypothetical protein